MDEGEGAIVWLIDGREVPFGPRDEPRRPWLEESTSWGSDVAPREGGEGAGDDEDGSPPELIWI